MITANIKRLLQRTRLVRLQLRGAKIGADCEIGPGVECSPGFLRQRGTIMVGDRCSLARGTVLAAWGGAITLGRNIFVGPYAVIYGHGGVEIGDDTLISMHCCILSSNHTVPPRGTTIRSQPDILLPTKIGRDVWLGANVTVLGGVTIGDGCIVGAGAVVTKDLPAYSIALGVPARVIRHRE